jgi:hypothetical protein
LSNDDAVMGIEQLAHEEHALREAEGHRPLSDEERKRLVWLEQRLDQCWDLLRQRRALINAGRDPEDASVRGVSTVEHYQQ